MLFLTKRFHLLLSLMIFSVFIMSACGPSAEEQAATSVAMTATAAPSTYTTTPTPTNTPLPPTYTPTSIPPTEASTPTIAPQLGVIPEGILVTFKGIKCTISGPTEVTTGEYTFVFRNLNDDPLDVHVSYLLEGKTYQDVVEMQGTPGRPWFGVSWKESAAIVNIGRNEARNEVYFTFSLEEGEHMIYLDHTTSYKHWLCGSLMVFE